MVHMVTPSLMLQVTTRRLRTSSPNFLPPSVPHFLGFSQCVGFWFGSDHEFALVETRSSWRWGTKTSSTSTLDKVGRPPLENRSSSGRIHSPRSESEKVHVEVRKGGSRSLQYGETWKLCPLRYGVETASVRSCPDPQRMSSALGPGYPLKIERGWEKRAGTRNSGVLGAEGSNQG